MPLLSSFLPLFLAATLLAGNVHAALLDFGPPVPQVPGSTLASPGGIGHGFPAWFRDTNRVPLQLCLEEVPGCLFAAADRPDPTQPARFPDNLPDEIFYNSAGATMTTSEGDALLFSGVEMNFTDNGDGTVEEVGFARVRIRFDTTVAGDYTVTTPYKQYFFTVTQAAIDDTGGLRVVNSTEDIGLGANGDFTGVLQGSVGPFLYSQGAPFASSYLGDNTPRIVQGSTFIPPGETQPANYFRIEGPVGFTTAQTNQFSVTGKLYTAPIPTPLTVEKATYALDNTGMQVNVFTTTQTTSNQKVGGTAFPGRFALTNIPSELQLSGAGIAKQKMMTNDPVDGKFFLASGLAPGTVPVAVTVTNTADTPDTAQAVNLVDEVFIDTAAYNPLTKVLAITASSLDKVNAPALQAFIPGMTAPLGTLAAGELNVSFPVIDSTVTPNKIYAIPPKTITIASAKGGSATASVFTFVSPATGVALTPNVASPQPAGTAVTITAAATGGDAGPYEYRFFFLPPNATSYTLGRAYEATPTWMWDTSGLPAGSYTILVYTRHVGSALPLEVKNKITYQIVTPATGATLTPGVTSPQLAGTSITFNAVATGGDAGPYEYRFYWRAPNSTTFIQGRAYGSSPTWTWNTNSLGLRTGVYTILVYTRHIGSPLSLEAKKIITFELN